MPSGKMMVVGLPVFPQVLPWPTKLTQQMDKHSVGISRFRLVSVGISTPREEKHKEKRTIDSGCTMYMYVDVDKHVKS